MDELENLLKRYRPSGPPAELRGRVLGGEPVGRPFRGRRWREWIYPIAAAAAAMTFYALTDSTHRRVLATSTPDVDRESAIAEMTAGLGGGDSARLEAERLIRATESAGVGPQVESAFVIEGSIP